MLLNTSKQTLKRREFLKASVLGTLGLQFASHSLARGVNAPRVKAKAKSVIEIWMWGGSCHLDTFDPKPEAGKEYCGPLNRAIEANVAGMRLNAALPKLAKQADKYALIRSMTHGINAHETASYRMQTGREAGDGQVYPSVGAVIAKLNGHDNHYKGIVPPYITLTQAKGRFRPEGFLGARYKPFVTGGNPSQARFAVEGIVSKEISDQRLLNRRELLNNLDSFGAAMLRDPEIARMKWAEQEAYELILGDARQLFNLASEPEKVRERYGMSHFGQSCLQARRLAEAGVPYITLNYRGWDTHKGHFNTMQRKLPEFDQGLAALLSDLADRGLLDSTLVWCSGEFGRTPRALWDSPWNGGRGHFGHCFSSLVAGGGFKGGLVVGESDAKGEEVRERPVYPQDFIGSIYQLAGIDPYGSILNGSGEPVPLILPSPSKSKGLLTEIM